ncbi:UDP-glucose dehydrogenase family protein [Amycolatopsis sp. cmx-11-12]|uniref:UDP-glucose dehydrogenase family protein n=1 Tax=Amycolatopsis sp. cmx-11-12 TaxID=2785795 RepID=UPI00391822E6
MTLDERVTVIGSGYVGLTAGACLASIGHVVTCVDHDAGLIAALRQGRTSLAEPDLESLIQRGIYAQTLSFDTSVEEAVRASDIVLLCLPTPSMPNGAADLTAICDMIARIRHLLLPDSVLVMKSTVPVGTNEKVGAWMGRTDIAIVSNPEFLREGHTVYDFLHPHRVLIGADDPAAGKRVASLYDAVRAQIIFTDPATAELAKYAANSYLATKISYINTVAELCEAFGGNMSDLNHVLGTDPRIGADYLQPGPGWGGPCLPKDAHALLRQAWHAGVEFPVLASAIESNGHHQRRVIARLREALGAELKGLRIAVLGLTFKAGTNDTRDSPALRIARAAVECGAVVTAHDPTVQGLVPGITVAVTPYDAAKNADGLVLLTDWPEYPNLDWEAIATAMTGDVVVDTRNVLDRSRLVEAGLKVSTWGGLC